MKTLETRGVAAGLLAVVILAILAPTSFAEPPESAPQHWERADVPTAEDAASLQGRGDWEAAAEAWGRIVETEPDNGTAWFNLGYCLHAAGHLDEAIGVHEKATTFEEYRGIAEYNLGCALALTGDADGAIEALGRSQRAGFAVRRHAGDDSDLDSLRNDQRFQALLANESANPVEEIMARVQRFMEEEAPRIEQQLSGMMHMAMQRAQGMIAMWQRKLAQDERFAGIMRQVEQWLGGARAERAPMPGFIEVEPDEPAVTVEPERAPATLQEATRLQGAGRWDEAASVYEQLVEQDPENGPAWFGLAYCIHMGGDHERAIAAHRKAADFPRFRGIALYNLACAYALTGHPDEAIEALGAAGEAGFDIEAARDDSDFDSLRGDPRLEAVIDGA